MRQDEIDFGSSAVQLRTLKPADVNFDAPPRSTIANVLANMLTPDAMGERRELP